MTILLESIKPVIIRDPKNRGRKWLKNFDDSFTTVNESSPNFYEKLGKDLSDGHNILIEITNQSTIDNMETNYIKPLIFLSDDVTSVEINGVEVNVNKESKVYLVINSCIPSPNQKPLPGQLVLPDDIKSEYVVLNYEEDEETLLDGISQDLMVIHNCAAFELHR